MMELPYAMVVFAAGAVFGTVQTLWAIREAREAVEKQFQKEMSKPPGRWTYSVKEDTFVKDPADEL
jgi:hypothetical protein